MTKRSGVYDNKDDDDDRQLINFNQNNSFEAFDHCSKNDTE